jgi:putative DNA primase/helicase
MNMTQKMLSSGWALVPIPHGQKGPVHSGWNLPSQCVTGVGNEDVLKGKNIGLAHAYCKPDPTCAIDIDNFKTAKPWLDSHGIDLKGLLEETDAVVIWSSKKFSLKLLYRLPRGTAPLASCKINGPDGQVSIEFRCATKEGKTVQDVLPPSIHPNGTEYKWLGPGDPLQVPVIPPAMLDLWGKLITKSIRIGDRKFSPELNHSPRLESPRQIAIIQDALSHISADCSYEIWRNIVWAILSTHWSCAESIALAWSRTAPDRFAENEDAFWTLVNSYMPNRQSQITAGTIYHHARLGGWRG